MELAYEMPYIPNIRGIILAGGAGSRIKPLTLKRTKSAIRFGGEHRLGEIVLTNMWRSGIRKIHFFTQSLYRSLSKDINLYYPVRSSSLDTYSIEIDPIQHRYGEEWSEGSGETLYYHRNLLEDTNEDDIAVFGGDNVYFMNIKQMLDHHKEMDADLTICAIPKKKSSCPIDNRDGTERIAFGVIKSLDNVVKGFEEKPSYDSLPEKIFASMGNYIFKRESLLEILKEKPTDIAHDIVRIMLDRNMKVALYDYSTNEVPGMINEREKGYWMDIADIDLYFEASMDLVNVEPRFNLYNPLWPMRDPPSKNVHSEGWIKGKRLGQMINSIFCPGIINSGATLYESIISRNVRIHSYTEIYQSILFPEVKIGRNCNIMNTIIDGEVIVPDNTSIGHDIAYDKSRGIHISPEGHRVVWKGYDFNFPRGYDPNKYIESPDFEMTAITLPKDLRENQKDRLISEA